MTKKHTVFLLILLSTLPLLAQVSRPQEPMPPYDYTEENVVFDNPSDNISLAGTLSYPSKTQPPYPAVILISGSGPQDRDSNVFQHKSFLVIAHYLTSNGIAVLRVDDRGVGQSQGDYNTTGLDGFVRDTEAAVKFLKTRQEVDPSKIGFIGHSLGGVIAPIIASQSDDIDFVVLLAAPGIPGDDLMSLQKEYIERKLGIPEDVIKIGQDKIKGAYELIKKSPKNSSELKKTLNNYFTETFHGKLPEAQMNALSSQLTLPWLTDFIKYNPAPPLKALHCPVLALNGSNDLQVPAKENLNAIKQALEAGGNKAIKIMELENLNHLFQTSVTGLPSEYIGIEETFSPKALKIIKDWILNVVK